MVVVKGTVLVKSKLCMPENDVGLSPSHQRIALTFSKKVLAIYCNFEMYHLIYFNQDRAMRAMTC